MTLKLGELFCGPGGLGLAAKNAIVVDSKGEKHTFSHAWANDYDASTCETYRRNITPNHPHSVICKDVRDLLVETVEEISTIDGLAFGFPCNDFSLVGEQRGMDGVYGPLYSYGVKMLHHFKPLFFLAENVSGLNSANDGKAFSVILDELFEAGYNVVPHLYKFEDYGVPQARHRIIIVGIRADQNLCFRVPVPFTTPRKTSRDAIENPPIPMDASNNEYTRQSEQVIARLKHIKPGQNAFNATIPEHLRLNVKNVTMSQIYRRLDPDKPAYTITGSGGGGTHVYHWCEDRALTNRERARLQTFPDDFIFSGSKENVRRQIGMAVPPQGAQIIFEAILKTFAQIEYPSRECNITPRTHNEPIFYQKMQTSQLSLELHETPEVLI
jgi:DNA (cytosine-5)-methyltransferase 1